MIKVRAAARLASLVCRLSAGGGGQQMSAERSELSDILGSARVSPSRMRRPVRLFYFSFVKIHETPPTTTAATTTTTTTIPHGPAAGQAHTRAQEDGRRLSDGEKY
jgi:hypothetical protein